MTKDELHRIVLNSTGNESNICQIYAIKNGLEVYRDEWHNFNLQDTMNVMSVTKGIMALLTGIAIDRGFIQSVDQKVLDFFPDYSVKRGEKTIYEVTLKHLLTMTAPYKYRSEPWTKVCTSDDWTKAALDLLGGKSGITGEFKYATLGIQILAGVLENAAGIKCVDFANRYLFEPLNIPPRAIHGDSSKEDQFDYLMSKGPRKKEWYCDPAGTVTAGWGLALSACDMAKIGWMLLNGGYYENTRVLPKQWIAEMTSPIIPLGPDFGNMYYGYLWYRIEKEKPTFAVIGDGGNIIYANPEKNVSVGITGTFKPRIYDRVAFIENNVLPLIERL